MYEPVYSVEHSALYFSTEPIPSERVFSRGHNVFVCGALQNPVTISAVVGLEPAFAPAVASGYRRSVERIGGEDIPLMVPDEREPGNVLTGVVWLGLSKESLEKIEALELGGGVRRRITIEVRVGELSLSAYTYVKK
jgi:hypothetical protein